MSTTRPVCGSRVTVETGALEVLGDDLGGALLVPGELGVGVQVAAQLEQLVVRCASTAASIRSCAAVDISRPG